VLSIVEPGGAGAPLVLDSPHSGRMIPDDFDAVASLVSLRGGEDSFVEALFPAAAHGATLVAAEFPRAYIDPNRALEDIDSELLEDRWPGTLAPSAKSAMGKGLIWRTCLGGVPIYDRRLRAAEVERRIAGYWRPYRETLAEVLDDWHARAGEVWHLDCHSMPSLWPPGVEGAGTPVEADFILGDRDGTTCSPALTATVRETLEGLGYRVAVNDRFKGVDIVRTNGRPEEHRHSLQIEVVRDRYMDQTRFVRGPRFERIRADLGQLLDAVRALAGH
jgi:N-formylglutamate deformylase